jgi:hypothetical protein
VGIPRPSPLSVITTHRWHRRASPALAWTEHTVGTFAAADWAIADRLSGVTGRVDTRPDGADLRRKHRRAGCRGNPRFLGDGIEVRGMLYPS